MSTTTHDSTTPIFGFEGPEKRLEVVFRNHNNPDKTLFSVTTEQWQRMLDDAKCTIISTMQNEYCISHVLSESSLFVFPYKVMIKTCGTTTLLRCIPLLLSYAKQLQLEIEFVWFSHKNLNFPGRQLFPHCSFDEETKYLNQFFDGSSHILGPLSGDHWFLYMADCRKDEPKVEDLESTMEILMHDIPLEVAQQFFRNDKFVDVKTSTKQSGIASLVPQSQIDDFMFEPCGYSMNGLRDQVYWTIHITPESHCSFVSFEVNASQLSSAEQQQMLDRVVSTFKPGRLVATLFSPELNLVPRKLAGYQLASRTAVDFGHHHTLMMASYSSANASPSAKVSSKVASKANVKAKPKLAAAPVQIF